MSDKTGIGWTDATWNPMRGCSLVSHGCTNCYAMKQAHRFSGKGGAYEGLTKMTSHGPTWTGKVRTVPELLDTPLRWRKPRRIFVNSMSDLFHEDVPDEFIAQVFAVMAECQHHTFQILTKRPSRMRDILSNPSFEDYATEYWQERAADRDTWALMLPLKNVWLGVSVEDQATSDERTPLLLRTPAAVRFISYEPALGPVNLASWLPDLDPVATTGGGKFDPRSLDSVLSHLKGGPVAVTGIVGRKLILDWVIVGGESGPRARPFDIQWARDIIGQCKAAGVAVFMKQTGSDHSLLYERVQKDRAGADPTEWPVDLRVREFPT